MDGYRLRRLRLLANEWGPLFVVLVAFLSAAQVEDTYDRAWETLDWVFLLIPLALVVAALWPVRILDVGPRGLGFRPRSLPEDDRRAGWRPSPRLRKVGWPYIAEITLTSRDGLVVLVVGMQDGRGGLRAAVVELPTRDEQAVASAIDAAAPGIALRREPLPAALTRTRQPYASAPRTARTWLLVVGLIAFGLVVDVTGAIVLDSTYLHPMVLISLACLWIWRGSSPLVVSPERLVLGPWPLSRTVRWADVVSVRLAAEGDAETLTLRDRAGQVRTRRISHRAELADVEAIIQAYAPPPALAAAV